MNFKKLMLSALLVVSTSLQAQALNGWGSDRRDDRREDRREDRRDPWENNQGSIRDVELQVRSYFQNQVRLDLIQDAYIRSQLQGKAIKEVIVTASTQMGNGQARLLVNGQSLEQPKTVARQMTQYTFRVDPFSNSIGQGLRNLELEMRGNFYVEKVVFSLLQNTTPTYPGPGGPAQPQIEVVRQQVNQTIQAEGGFQLFRMFNLGNERQGQALRRVTVLARATRGAAQISLLKNNEQNTFPQTIGSLSSRVTFEVGGLRIGQEIQNLRLFIRGDVLVEEVSLEFDRSTNIPGPGPILENRIEQMINQRLYETSGVLLTQLMRIDPRQHNRMVHSVEITTRNADYGTRLSLCQQVLSQPVVNCGPVQIMPSGMQRIVLTTVNFARLSELMLSVRMGMIDVDRIVINLK